MITFYGQGSVTTSRKVIN